MKVLVIGASRGIGLEFVRQYRQAGDAVTATARAEAGLDALRGAGATALRLDVADAESASSLGWQVENAGFDVAVVNAGVAGPRGGGLAVAEADFDDVMHTNVLGPMRVLPQLEGAMKPGGKVAVLSSRMGSMGARTSGGMSLYRASKAAVNSVVKDAALGWGSRLVCVAFHPGWVKTDMGGAGADIDVATSVSGLREVMARLGERDSGGFFDYRGDVVPW